MITTPSPAHLVRTVRLGLEAHVAPAVADPAVAAALAQAGLVLRYVEAVIDHEVEWIRDEVDDIHATARAIIAEGTDTTGKIQGVLQDSLDKSAEGADPPTARAAYQRASEVLSVCLEAAIPVGGRAYELATAALRRRIETEAAIRGAAGIGFTSRVDAEEEGS